MAAYRRFMTHVTCRLTAKNGEPRKRHDQLWNPTLGNRVWATFLYIGCIAKWPISVMYSNVSIHSGFCELEFRSCAVNKPYDLYYSHSVRQQSLTSWLRSRTEVYWQSVSFFSRHSNYMWKKTGPLHVVTYELNIE